MIQPLDSRLPVILISGTIWSSLWIADYLWSWYPGWFDPASGPQITRDPDIQDDLIQSLDRRLPVILIPRMIWSSLWTAVTCDPDIRDDLIQPLDRGLPVILISRMIWSSLWTAGYLWSWYPRQFEQHLNSRYLWSWYPRRFEQPLNSRYLWSWYTGRSNPASEQEVTCDPDIQDDLIQPLDSRLPVILISGTIWSSLWTADYLWSWYPGRSNPASGSQITCDPDIQDDLFQPLDRRLPVILISGTILSSLWTAAYLWSWYPGRSNPASEQQITCDPDIQDDLIQPLNSRYLWSWYLGRSDPASGQQITCDPEIRDDLIQTLDRGLPVILISGTIWSSLWTADYLWSWYPGWFDPASGP